jgi:hypothetical protein
MPAVLLAAGAVAGGWASALVAAGPLPYWFGLFCASKGCDCWQCATGRQSAVLAVGGLNVSGVWP